MSSPSGAAPPPHGEPPRLSGRHQDTLEQIFRHPVSHNIEWRHAIALLDEAGTVTEQHDGKFTVTLSGTTLVLTRPHGKDLGEQQVLDLRRLLEGAGFGPAGSRA